MRGVYTFSGREVWQLVVSTVVLASAFALPLSCSYLFESFLVQGCGEPGIKWDTFLFPALPISLVIVIAAFVLHELAHKLVAQRYGHWAEFRASMPGLLIALAISASAGESFTWPSTLRRSRAPPTPRRGCSSCSMT